VRSIQYNYTVTEDENGNPEEILAVDRKVYVTVFDGHLAGAMLERAITMNV